MKNERSTESFSFKSGNTTSGRSGLRIRQRKAQTCFVFVISISALSLLTFIIITDMLPPDLIPWPSWISGRKEDHSRGNYFLDIDRLSELGLIVNTSKCQIPDFSPWDPAMLRYIHKAEPAEDCKKTNYNWTYMDGNDLILEKANMDKDGYSFGNGSCGYKIITRVTQDENNYDGNADNRISYSEFIPISNIRTTVVSAEFLVVECFATEYLQGLDVIYRGFHASANPLTNSRPETKKKLLYWESIKSHSTPLEGNQRLPPNILILGIDSTSRINFRRNMFKTLKILEEDLKAIEMLGYTKVGENTFPNFDAIFHGYEQKEVQSICYKSTKIKQDDCPFIWKRLDAANYLTAHSEDSPDYTAFNYRQTGFVKQPVDFYLRPFFLAAHEYGTFGKTDHLDCIGHQTNDEAIATYIESIMDLAFRTQTPVFSLSWSTGLSHSDPNSIQLSDETYAGLLQRLKDKGILDNTILIFMGDHGYRFGDWRETLIGYYEDKLPNFWLSLPEWIKEEYPEWQQALEINSRRLTSPFTFHWTLNYILDTFTNTTAVENSRAKETGKIVERRYRQNFFEIVPEANTCGDVGIPEVYCACYPLQTVNLNDRQIFDAALAATNFINKEVLSDKCVPLQVSKITAGAMMDKTSLDLGQRKMRFIVSFVTIPGGFVFEAELDFYADNQTFSGTPNIQRANKINQNYVKCISDKYMELFCYCL